MKAPFSIPPAHAGSSWSPELLESFTRVANHMPQASEGICMVGFLACSGSGWAQKPPGCPPAHQCSRSSRGQHASQLLLVWYAPSGLDQACQAVMYHTTCIRTADSRVDHRGCCSRSGLLTGAAVLGFQFEKRRCISAITIVSSASYFVLCTTSNRINNSAVSSFELKRPNLREARERGYS